jgi:hypothetical protein
VGTDNLFWKNKDEVLKRKSRNKIEPPNSFLIVCEGEKTEPNYFQVFRSRLHTVNVRVEGCGMNTKSLVKRSLEISEKARVDEEEYDQVWCVFDKDDNTMQNFKAALALAEKKNIRVAYSNQAFELWYLLHFHYFNTGMSRDDYKDKLSNLLKFPYKKNSQDMYRVLINKQEKAIKNAERLLKNYDPPNPGMDNPATTIHLLVQELNRFLPK